MIVISEYIEVYMHGNMPRIANAALPAKSLPMAQTYGAGRIVLAPAPAIAHASGMDWALFLSALISSTLLPGGSEALLLYKLHAGGDAPALVATATVGNVLGSLITYGMGRLGNGAMHRRWLRMSDKEIDRAERWFDRYGQPSLLFAWLPVVGDPLCLVAGLLRSPAAAFLLLVTVGKLARYAFLAWLPV